MRRTLLLFSILHLSFLGAFSQDQDPIGTDRPSQAPSAALIAAGTFQFESGVFYDTFEGSNLTSINSLWRIGINSNFEFRAYIDYLSLNQDLDGSDGNETGWAPLQLGTKVKLSDQNGWIPQTALVAMIAIPSGEGSFESRRARPDLRITMANDIPGALDLFYSVGIFWTPESFEVVNLYTFGTGITISDRVWSFVEFYGYFNDYDIGPSINGGFTWLATDNIKVDLTGGLDFPSEGGGFISTGISFRL